MTRTSCSQRVIDLAVGFSDTYCKKRDALHYTSKYFDKKLNGYVWGCPENDDNRRSMYLL